VAMFAHVWYSEYPVKCSLNCPGRSYYHKKIKQRCRKGECCSISYRICFQYQYTTEKRSKAAIFYSCFRLAKTLYLFNRKMCFYCHLILSSLKWTTPRNINSNLRQCMWRKGASMKESPDIAPTVRHNLAQELS